MTRGSLRLTADLVARVPPAPGELPPPDGTVRHTDEDIAVHVRETLADHPRGEDLVVFAFGSLIWKPGIKVTEDGLATARGWHRTFRMRLTNHRGTPDRPGLMMGLDRGGTCRGVMLRIAARGLEDELHALYKREMPFKRERGLLTQVPKWLTVHGESGPRRTIAFVMNRRGVVYTGPLGMEVTADMLATGAGSGGSCAEYLYNTVSHLADRGIRDRNLWRLQEMVAERLSRLADQEPPPT